MVCETAPDGWRRFIDQLNSLSVVPVYLIVHADKPMENNLKLKYSDLPLYFDSNDEFFELNDFPLDKRFRCFLLDEDNRVILIGNPLHNPKIRDFILISCPLQALEKCFKNPEKYSQF